MSSVASTIFFKRSWWKFFLTFLLGGLVCYPLVRYVFISQEQTTQKRQIHEGLHGLINPLLDCQIYGKSEQQQDFKPLSAMLRTLTADKIAQNKVEHLAVYFRDLNNGRWSGINEDENFYAASLEKVPLMLAYYKLTDTQSDVLDKTILYKGDVNRNLGQNIQPSKDLIAGRSYFVSDLIEQMIIYSGNNPFYLLWQQMPTDLFQETFRDIGVPIIFTPGTDYSISARNFSRFFRVMYNATYLGREYSQKALTLLTKTEFKDGLRSDIPESIPIAHKFGEHGNIPANDRLPGPYEMHDCGIIYQPQHPYFLCVMTSGKQMDDMEDVIKEISHVVYQYVDQDYNKP